MKKIVALGMAVMISGIGQTPASAQTLPSLEAILDSDFEPSYPFVRCAAFYQANLEWAGQDVLGPETSEQLDETIRTLVATAVVVRAGRKGGDGGSAIDSTLADTRKITDIYIERYRANYATSGQAWALDEVWKSDLEICREMTERLQQKYNG